MTNPSPPSPEGPEASSKSSPEKRSGKISLETTVIDDPNCTEKVDYGTTDISPTVNGSLSEFDSGVDSLLALLNDPDLNLMSDDNSTGGVPENFTDSIKFVLEIEDDSSSVSPKVKKHDQNSLIGFTNWRDEESTLLPQFDYFENETEIIATTENLTDFTAITDNDNNNADNKKKGGPNFSRRILMISEETEKEVSRTKDDNRNSNDKGKKSSWYAKNAARIVRNEKKSKEDSWELKGGQMGKESNGTNFPRWTTTAAAREGRYYYGETGEKSIVGEKSKRQAGSTRDDKRTRKEKLRRVARGSDRLDWKGRLKEFFYGEKK